MSTCVLAACATSTAAQVPTSPSPSRSATAIPATQVKVFQPSDAVARTVRGTCWTSSITVATPTAYRCFASGAILDPCFASGTGVACYASPWAEAVRMTLTAPLPRITPLTITHPWALQLADGTRCVAATGVVARVGAVPLLYRCGAHGAAGLPARAGGHEVVDVTATGAAPLHRVVVGVTWQA